MYMDDELVHKKYLSSYHCEYCFLMHQTDPVT